MADRAHWCLAAAAKSNASTRAGLKPVRASRGSKMGRSSGAPSPGVGPAPGACQLRPVSADRDLAGRAVRAEGPTSVALGVRSRIDAPGAPRSLELLVVQCRPGVLFLPAVVLVAAAAGASLPGVRRRRRGSGRVACRRLCPVPVELNGGAGGSGGRDRCTRKQFRSLSEGDHVAAKPIAYGEPLSTTLVAGDGGRAIRVGGALGGTRLANGQRQRGRRFGAASSRRAGQTAGQERGSR